LGPASETGAEYWFWRTVTNALASTNGRACSKLSNGSAGNGRSNSISSDSAWPIVTRRPRIVRDRSLIMHTAR
jgi:hypothetical protein